jgi:hypothetical protein
MRLTNQTNIMLDIILSKLGMPSIYTSATFLHIVTQMRVSDSFRPFIVQQKNTLHIPNAQMYYCNRAGNAFKGYNGLSQEKELRIKNTLRMSNARLCAEVQSKAYFANLPMPSFKSYVVFSGDIAVWWL